MNLLPSQEAALARLIAEHAPTPSDFTLAAVDAGFAEHFTPNRTAGVVHRPTGLWFGIVDDVQVGNGDSLRFSGFRVAFSPGQHRERGEVGSLTWNDVLKACREWLGFVLRELTAPAFEEVLERGGLGVDDGRSGEVFDQEERKALEQALARIERELVEIRHLHQDAQSTLRGEFAELREELQRMGRGRWRKFAMGTLIALLAKGLLTPETVRFAWTAIEHAAGRISAFPPLRP